MTKLIPLLLLPCLCEAAQFIDLPDIGNNSYLNARYLNHTTGRFLTQDDKKQFKSHYVYGNGRIIKTSDPSGNMFGNATAHMFSDVFSFIDSAISRDVGSAMSLILKENTTIVVPKGGSIDTHMVVRDRNHFIVSIGQRGMVDVTSIFPPHYDSIIPETEHPYRQLPNPHVNVHTEVLYLNPSRDERSTSYGSITRNTHEHPKSHTDTFQSRVNRARNGRNQLRRAESETPSERTHRLLNDFDDRVGVFSNRNLDMPRHHNDYNSYSFPDADNLGYTSYDFIMSRPNLYEYDSD